MTNPGDIVRIRSRNGGRGSVYEANMWAQGLSQGLYSGNGALQNTVPDMNVLVGGSPSSPDVVIGVNPSGYRIVLDIIGQQAIQVTAPASNSRIASVIAYSDDLALASTESNTTGSPASCGLIVVYGPSAASPQPPTDASIRTAITADGATGSQAVYGVITEIKVESSATAITNVAINTGMKRAQIGTDTLAESAVTSSKLNLVVSVVSGFTRKQWGSYNEYSIRTPAYSQNASAGLVNERYQLGVIALPPELASKLSTYRLSVQQVSGTDVSRVTGAIVQSGGDIIVWGNFAKASTAGQNFTGIQFDIILTST